MFKNKVELDSIGKTQAPKIRKMQASYKGKAGLECGERDIPDLLAVMREFLGFAGFFVLGCLCLDLKGVGKKLGDIHVC